MSVAINHGDRPASSPYTTRAAIRPDRRLLNNHHGGSAYASGGHGRKTLLRTPDIANRVEPSEGVHAKSDRGSTSDRALCLSAKLCPVLQIQVLCSMKLTAAGCRRPAAVRDGRTPPRTASARRIQPKRGCEKMGSQSAVACPEATATVAWPTATDHGQS